MTGSTIEITSGVLCVLASVLYASAVLLNDTHLESVLKAMPWILTAAGCAVFDVLVSFHYVMLLSAVWSLGDSNMTSVNGPDLLF